jgi:hypothetical protein
VKHIRVKYVETVFDVSDTPGLPEQAEIKIKAVVCELVIEALANSKFPYKFSKNTAVSSSCTNRLRVVLWMKIEFL